MKRRRLVSHFGPLLAVTLAVGGSAVKTQADYPAAVLANNPVHYWRLNETTAPPPGDVAINSGTFGVAGQGDYLDGATHGETIAGIPGAGSDTAAHFPNANGGWGGYARVRIPYKPELNAKAPFSVELWAKPANLNDLGCVAASVDFNVAPRLGWLFYQGNSAADPNRWQFRVYRPDTTTPGTAYTVVTMDTTKWYHLVGVYDGTNVKLYVNGTLAPTASVPLGGEYSPNTNPTIPMTFGGRADGVAGNYGWGGDIDEAAYYGAALSDAQVLAHYQAGINPRRPNPTIRSCWRTRRWVIGE